MYKPKLIEELRNRHNGETLWIVGKGPSIKNLNNKHIGGGPVIAINQSLFYVRNIVIQNHVYSMQKDGCGTCGDYFPAMCATCKITPKNETLLVHRQESGLLFMDYAPRYVFDCQKDFGVKWDTFSSAVALLIGRLFGCNKFVFLCHDSCTNGNCQEQIHGVESTVRGTREYKAQAFILKSIIEEAKLNVEWVTP